MAKVMSFLSISRATAHLDSVVNVGRLFLRPRALSSLGAVVAMLSALFVIGRRKDSARALPVDLVANRQVTNEMAQSVCHVCLKDRRSHGHSGRRIFRTPIEVTQDPAFRRKGVPARLCPVCDGEAYEMAMRGHEHRTGNGAETDV